MSKPDTAKTPPSAVIIPFGKHKGSTVAELLMKDPSYADWVAAQGWVADRFAELHAAIITRGAGVDDTPEHNALQARFLDSHFGAALVSVCGLGGSRRSAAEGYNWKLKERLDRVKSKIAYIRDQIEWLETPRAAENPLISQAYYKRLDEEHQSRLRRNRCEVDSLGAEEAKLQSEWDNLSLENYGLHTTAIFERRGVDVELTTRRGGCRLHQIGLELKPTLGDDYPTVMRQMRRLEVSICVVGHWTGRGTSEPQVRAMFKANGCRLVFLQEIEEELRRRQEANDDD